MSARELLTRDVCAAIRRLRAAERAYDPENDSYSVIELPKIQLADAFLRALSNVRLKPVKAAHERRQRKVS